MLSLERFFCKHSLVSTGTKKIGIHDAGLCE